MNIEHDADKVLRNLICDAEVAARRSMEKTGGFPPTIFIDGIEGRVTYSPPAKFLNVSADDLSQLTTECGLAYGAIAVVVAGEGWKVKTPNQRDALGPDGHFLNADDREEVVAFIGETRYEKLKKLRPIIRSESGDFLGLGAGINFDDPDAYRDYANMLTTKFPDKEDRDYFKAELRKAGHHIDRGRGMERGM